MEAELQKFHPPGKPRLSTVCLALLSIALNVLFLTRDRTRQWNLNRRESPKQTIRFLMAYAMLADLPIERRRLIGSKEKRNRRLCVNDFDHTTAPTTVSFLGLGEKTFYASHILKTSTACTL